MDSPPPVDTKAAIALLTKSVAIMRESLSTEKKIKYPYLTAKAAAEVAEAVDAVTKSGVPLIWPAYKVSVGTLYMKFRQGAQYLVQDQPEYQSKLDAVQATKIERKGLRIAPKEVKSGLKLFFEDLTWRTALEEYLETSTHGDVFERVAIPLSTEDHEWLAATLKPVAHLFVSDISPSKILLIRHDNS